jgi:hypothetical protein
VVWVLITLPLELVAQGGTWGVFLFTPQSFVTFSSPALIQFAAFVDSELSSVKASLASECAVREAEDDAIEKSLTSYTTRLQRSLRVLNSTDQ